MKSCLSVERATRLCEINGEFGYFHTWEHWMSVVGPSPMIGGHPGGQVSQIYGIVEFSDRIERVDPVSIKFCDEINAGLTVMNSGDENLKIRRVENDLG